MKKIPEKNVELANAAQPLAAAVWNDTLGNIALWSFISLLLGISLLILSRRAPKPKIQKGV